MVALILSVVSTLASVAAVLVAIYFARRQVRLGREQADLVREQADLQRRLAAIEVDRREEELGARDLAELIAEFVPGATSTGSAKHDFVITNLGPAVAREIDFEISGVKPSDPVPVDVLRTGHSFPIPMLHPGQTYSVLADPVRGTGSAARVILRWEDDTGDREMVLILNV